MKKKESLFDKGKRTLPITFGIVLTIFFVMIYLSAWAPHFQGLAYLIGLFGGFCGFNFFLPLFVYFSLRLVFNVKRKVGFKRRITGYVIISFSLGVLLLDIGFNGYENLGPSGYISELTAASSYLGTYCFDTKLGAGFFSYFIAGFFSSIFEGNFVKVFSSISIIIGVLILFAPTVGKLVKIVKKFTNSRKIARAKKRREIEEKEGVDLSKISTSLLNTELAAPPKLVSNNDENVTSSRYERNMSSRLNNNPHIPEKRINFSNSSTGLVPALFGVEEQYVPMQEAKIEPQQALPEIALPNFNEEKEENKNCQEEQPVKEEPTINETFKPIEVEENISINEPTTIVEETTVFAEKQQDLKTESIPVEPIQTEQVSESVSPSTGVATNVETSEEQSFEEEQEQDDSPEEIVHEEERMDVVFNYDYPSIDLLNPVQPQTNMEEMEKSCLENEEKINSKLESLGVGAYVVSHTIGPSVTRYEIKTNDDVSVSSLSRVINDLSIKLNGVPIRFETLVRGSETSGLEVVNQVSSTVYFKECFESVPDTKQWKLLFPFGKNVSGEVLYSDLAAFPHMLVAGTSGSGKSVFIHQILLSLIMKNSPNQLKLLLIDPKHIELGMYRELPHLICPVVNEPFRAKVALEKIRDEMDRRYMILDQAGGMDFDEWNSSYAESHNKPKLPFIVVVIDEFGDLVDSCKNISELVLKIAAKARAAGIHIILATQRPDVSVISGTIKANLHVRVALSMSSVNDSMTIIGQGGAEDLNGRGDMLIECKELQRVGLIRCQGAFVAKEEIRRVAEYIRSTSKPQYWKEFLDLNDRSEEESAPAVAMPSPAEMKEASDEKKYQLIKEFIMARDYASASGLQTEFGIGYPKAAKFIQRLAKEGIITNDTDARNGPKGRYVLIHIEDKPSEPVGSLSGTTVIPEGFPQPGDDN